LFEEAGFPAGVVNIVTGYGNEAGEPHMSPFGGYKRSGIGRESGIDALREYLQTKSVWIDVSVTAPNPFVIR
jgi:acyl-CoA reductase-like NAD-dependent aldehyde dehydrogenase